MKSSVSPTQPADKPGRPRFPPRTPRPDLPLALEGIRVVDFTRLVSGPVTTQVLADMGAEVIKIENPHGGDDMRGWKPRIGKESGSFLSCNRNKKSVALNLKQPEAIRVVLDLVERADVVVENFSPGVMRSFGLDFETLAKINPRLIYCSLSGYGSEGPLSTRLGYDSVFQAESGLMSVTGDPSGPPTRSGVPIVDYTSGVTAANGILAALFAREKLGRGQYLEVAMYDVALNMLVNFGMNYLVSGNAPRREGNFSPLASPVGIVEASDGQIYLSCANDRLWNRMVEEVLQSRELAEDTAFATNDLRIRNRDRLFSELNRIFGSRSRDHWMDRLLEAKIPAGAVRDIGEALTSNEARERGIVGEIPHPTVGPIPAVASALRLSLTPAVHPVAPPVLGGDTETVLRDMLGYDQDKIAGLKATGALG